MGCPALCGICTFAGLAFRGEGRGKGSRGEGSGGSVRGVNLGVTGVLWRGRS